MSKTAAIPFSAGALWAEKGWALLRRRPFFFVFAALAVLGLRWLFDFAPVDGASAVVIAVSYLTDALVVATLWTALDTPGGTGLWGGWRRLAGRRWRVALSGLWGLPSAALGYVMLALSTTLAQPVSMALGTRFAGWALLAWIFLSGAVCCLLLFGALFAAIDTARGETRLWTAGMRGMRAMVLGWRPLLALWTAFVCGAALVALVSATVLGHLGFDVIDGADRDLLEYWINWPALFAAVLALLCMIGPAARQLFATAEQRSLVDGQSESTFGQMAARRLGVALMALATVFALAGMFAIDMSLDLALLGSAGLATTGWALNRSAPAWGNLDSSLWERWNWVAAAALWAAVVAGAA